MRLLNQCLDLKRFTVQRVRAIGRPPENKICFFRNLKNCVVLPARGIFLGYLFNFAHLTCVILGERSLASCLGGGDLDG
jgi:RNA-dependent RNA polymerase